MNGCMVGSDNPCKLCIHFIAYLTLEKTRYEESDANKCVIYNAICMGLVAKDTCPLLSMNLFGEI